MVPSGSWFGPEGTDRTISASGSAGVGAGRDANTGVGFAVAGCAEALLTAVVVLLTTGAAAGGFAEESSFATIGSFAGGCATPSYGLGFAVCATAERAHSTIASPMTGYSFFIKIFSSSQLYECNKRA